MAAPTILYIDSTNKVQVGNFLTSQQPGSQLALEAGDTIPIQLHFLQKNGTTVNGASTQLPYSYIDPSTVTPVTMAVGLIGQVPTAGTFTITYGANTTTALAYNVSASALSTAVNLLASVISAGGVTVTGPAGGPYRLTFTTTGVVSTLFEVNAALLAPTSLGITAVAVTGATGIAEVQVIRLIQTPAAVQNTWTPAYGAMSVTRIQAGGSGLNEIQRVTVPQGTYAGAFALAFGGVNTSGLLFNASGTTVQTALQSVSTVGSGNATVIQSSSVAWDVTFTGTLAGSGQSLLVANSAGLQMPMYLEASLDMSVEGVFDLLQSQGVNTLTATLQIQQGTLVNTVVQTPVTINNTLIQGTPSVPIAGDPWQTLTQVNALIAAAGSALPTASTTVKGGVKIDGVTVLIDGSAVISVPNATTSTVGLVKTDGATITNSAGAISARTATGSVLGVVKPDGTSITIASGVISATPYSLPTASTSVLGGVKVDGTSITISSGVISTASGYVLPTASTVTLGGVKVDGTSITIASGVISTAGYTLPTASTSVLGGVKVDGSSIQISSGVISVPAGTSSGPGIVQLDGTTINTLGGVIYASTATTSALGVVIPDGTTIAVSGGTISAVTATTGNLGVVQPDGSSITITGGVISATGGSLATDTTAGIVIVPTAGNLVVDGSGSISVPTSTTSVLGVVKIDGTSITISSGVISATATALATTTTAGTVIVPTTGHLAVDGSGNITVPLASSSVFGVMKTSTGLTSTSGVVTVNSSQSISTLSNLTSNGSVQTSGGTGALSVVANTGTGSNVLGTAPTIAGGSITALTALAIRDTSAAFDVTLAGTSSTALTAGRTLTVDVVNAARTLKLTGNPTLADWFDQSVKTTATPQLTRLGIGAAADATFPLIISAPNVAGSNVQVGRLESRDYGSGNAINNIVLGAGATGSPNIRLQVDSSTAHIGFNIAGSAGSAAIIINDSGGNGQLQLRSTGAQTGSGLITYLTQTATTFVQRSNGAFENISDGVGANVNTQTAYDANAGSSGTVILRHARGTEASPTALLTDDRLGGFFFGGQYDTTSGHFANVGAVLCRAGENFSSTNQGTYLQFETTAVGSNSRLATMILDGSGNLASTASVAGGIAKAGTGFASFAEFSYGTLFGAAGTYGMMHSSVGNLYLNAATTRTISMRVNNTEVVSVAAGGAVVAGSLTTGAPSGGTAKAFKVGNVATVTPTLPNRTIELEIDGTTYYLAAKTTNN